MARRFLSLPLLAIAACLPAGGAKYIPSVETAPPSVSQLWRNPGDVGSWNLFYGPGGKADAPQGPFTFDKEDLKGHNPKFSVRDRNGVRWKVKLGVEARPETAASRFLWATGYYADEDYFLPYLKVNNMPRLHRGERLVVPDGSVRNVRLKRHPRGEKNMGDWKWRHDPFAGDRAWNGLRVVMCLLNNWDLKDLNNAVRKIHGRPVYLVSDLGASFGAGGWRIRQVDSKGNLRNYERSRFITKVTPQYVNFSDPSRFDPIHRVEWIGRRIPRADARWIGQLLSRLSDDQIQDAFRAAGYKPEEVKAFSAVMEERIAELKEL